MGMNMKLPFLRKTRRTPADYNARSNPSWPLPEPSCHQNPKALSFTTENMLKSTSSSTSSDECKGECLETFIKGLRSERLFFKPGETRSILDEANKMNKEPGRGDYKELLCSYEESVVFSQNPYVDFKKSMEEMVEVYGLEDWDSFEELLSCYLNVNGKSNHGYIIGAFVDMLLGLWGRKISKLATEKIVRQESCATNSSSATSDQFCCCSSSSALSSSCLEIEEDKADSCLFRS